MAAKNKKKTSKQGIMSKIINIALIALSFARPLTQIMSGNTAYFTRTGGGTLIHEATFGLASGKFDLQAGAKLYAPAGAAAALGFIKRYALRKFPVRR